MKSLNYFMISHFCQFIHKFGIKLTIDITTKHERFHRGIYGSPTVHSTVRYGSRIKRKFMKSLSLFHCFYAIWGSDCSRNGILKYERFHSKRWLFAHIYGNLRVLRLTTFDTELQNSGILDKNHQNIGPKVVN